MIRSLLILGVILGSVAFILLNPAVGILMWTWISVLNPHRLTYGFASSFPVGNIIAGATILGWLITREPKRLPTHPIVILLIIYVLWTSITTIFAYDDTAFDKWSRFAKIMLLVFLTLSIMKSRIRVHAFVWMNVLCIGYFAVKGGLFTVATGGGSRVWGPPDSFIEDNNQLGLAMVMTLPLLRYLYQQSTTKLFKWGLNGATLLWLLAILGTQSRGAFVALSCMLVFLWFRSKNKLVTGLLLIFVAVSAVSFMPDSFRNRMETVQNYDEDESFMGRVVMWRFALKVARDNPVLGGGFNVFYDQDLRDRYLEPGETGRAVHSIYFEVLGEQGYIGFAMFFLIGVAAFFTCGRTMALTSKRPDLAWANSLARMSQVSVVGYAINGITLNLATFDLYYSLLAIIVLNRIIVERALAKEGVDTGAVPAWHPRAILSRAGAR
jgi:probable O-glycosylation ligase (exosortase A-associated)